MIVSRSLLLVGLIAAGFSDCYAWGFYSHKKINYYAVFLLPPEMLKLYKPQIEFLTEHAVDPDMRRYAIKEEAPRHYIDIDTYGQYPWHGLPHRWDSAVAKFTEDSLRANGIVPWWVQTMLGRLTKAFKEKDQAKILKLSAEIGHYIADAHVPLHASSNHDGQQSNQKGIHAFWESRLPELFADKQYDFFIGKADFIKSPGNFIWNRVMESGAASDTVLKFEAALSSKFPSDQKYSFEDRNGKVIRQYSSAYSAAYQESMKGMVERRMRQSIYAVASFWYTAWVNAGQPDLGALTNKEFSADDINAFEELQSKWKAGKMIGVDREQ
ncbi:MAG: zinc dependent phospholipase C family protein [Chitinophagaceae bacterium]